MPTVNFPLTTYYPLNVGDRWHYTAPPGWGGDYISRIEEGPSLPIGSTVRHFDATNAAKVLCYLPSRGGLYYLREEFSDSKSYVEFEQPILWFPDPLQIGTQVNITTSFTRYQDGSNRQGEFTLWQNIAAIEDVQVSAGSFGQCLRVVGTTHWKFDDSRQARSETVYHYAPSVGVVKATARFIVYDSQGQETVNRLVETDLKFAVVKGSVKGKR